MMGSPGQAAPPAAMTLLAAGTAAGQLLVATSGGPGPPCARRELRSSQLHCSLPQASTSRFSRGAAGEPSRTVQALHPLHPSAPAHSLGTQVGVLPAQQVWPHKQLQRPHNVCGLLQGQRGQGMSSQPREMTQ